MKNKRNNKKKKEQVGEEVAVRRRWWWTGDAIVILLFYSSAPRELLRLDGSASFQSIDPANLKCNPVIREQVNSHHMTGQ